MASHVIGAVRHPRAPGGYMRPGVIRRTATQRPSPRQDLRPQISHPRHTPATDAALRRQLLATHPDAAIKIDLGGLEGPAGSQTTTSAPVPPLPSPGEPGDTDGPRLGGNGGGPRGPRQPNFAIRFCNDHKLSIGTFGASTTIVALDVVNVLPFLGVPTSVMGIFPAIGILWGATYVAGRIASWRYAKPSSWTHRSVEAMRNLIHHKPPLSELEVSAFQARLNDELSRNETTAVDTHLAVERGRKPTREGAAYLKAGIEELEKDETQRDVLANMASDTRDKLALRLALIAHNSKVESGTRVRALLLIEKLDYVNVTGVKGILHSMGKGNLPKLVRAAHNRIVERQKRVAEAPHIQPEEAPQPRTAADEIVAALEEGRIGDVENIVEALATGDRALPTDRGERDALEDALTDGRLPGELAGEVNAIIRRLGEEGGGQA